MGALISICWLYVQRQLVESSIIDVLNVSECDSKSEFKMGGNICSGCMWLCLLLLSIVKNFTLLQLGEESYSLILIRAFISRLVDGMRALVCLASLCSI